MPAQADRQNTDPSVLRAVLACHAHELAPLLVPPAGPESDGADQVVALHRAEQAAAYAMAAFDPQDAVDAMMVRTILMTSHAARCPSNPDALALRLRATITILLKSLDECQVRARMRDAPPIPGRRRKTPKRLDMPPVVPLPDGVAH